MALAFCNEVHRDHLAWA